MRNLLLLDVFRITTQEVVDFYGDTGDETCGVFCVNSKVDAQPMMIVASSGEGWDHVSVSRRDRTPHWEEMDQVKRLFFNTYEMALQFHVPEADHVNCHPNCLHLWRPLEQVITLPPKEFVGPKQQDRAYG